MKRALVLGGGGFIGSHLVKRLSSEGTWVRCMDLRRPQYASSAANEFLIGDLRDPTMCSVALEGGFEEVYQLAAADPATGPAAAGESNADNLRDSALINLNVLSACVTANVGRIFHSASISSACGNDADWAQQFSEQLYLAHARDHEIGVCIARLPNIFGRESPWNDGREGVPAELCRKIATAESGSEIEVWCDNGTPWPFLPIDQCLDDIGTLMRSAHAEPVSLGSYVLPIAELALMIMDVAGKSLSIRNVACRFAQKEGSSEAPLERRPHSPLTDGLRSTYQWIKMQVEAAKPDRVTGRATRDRSRATDVCLLERVRDAIKGRDLIDWADTDFESLRRELDVIELSDVSQMKDRSIYANSLPAMVRFHAQRRTTHVLVTSMDENWGAFSSHIPNRTYPQGDWEKRVIDEGCSPEAVRKYLDDPAVKAVVTPQHTAFEHPAILSIPIGIHNPRTLIDHLSRSDGAKTQDLLINNNAWVGGDRERINQRAIANFGGGLRNTYGLPLTEFYQSIIGSRFVLCPSGMGLDTHRLWETLILGSIPIVERCAGWQRVLDDLPAVRVTDFVEVTPALLARAYQDIHAKCDSFDFAKLTRQWWTTRIRGLLDGPMRNTGAR